MPGVVEPEPLLLPDIDPEPPEVDPLVEPLVLVPPVAEPPIAGLCDMLMPVAEVPDEAPRRPLVVALVMPGDEVVLLVVPMLPVEPPAMPVAFDPLVRLPLDMPMPPEVGYFYWMM